TGHYVLAGPGGYIYVQVRDDVSLDANTLAGLTTPGSRGGYVQSGNLQERDFVYQRAAVATGTVTLGDTGAGVYVTYELDAARSGQGTSSSHGEILDWIYVRPYGSVDGSLTFTTAIPGYARPNSCSLAADAGDPISL